MKNYTDINVLLDRSGSMDSIAQDMRGGFDGFIEDQKKLSTDEATVSLYQFDDRYETVYEGKSIHQVPKLTLSPRGSTALYDALGRTINAIGKRLGDLHEDQRPNKVVVLIITDGGENASKEFQGNKIQQMISHQRDVYSWAFVFLGANQDAIKTAADIGINGNFAISYAANSKGATSVIRSMSANLSHYRSSGDLQKMSFSAEDRNAQTSAGVTSNGQTINPSLHPIMKSLTATQIEDLKNQSRSLTKV